MRLNHILALGLAHLVFGANTTDPIAINTKSGVTYRGTYSQKVEFFSSIRFGQDTGGANRFKPPRAYTPPANSSIDATSSAPACPQQNGTNLAPLYLGNITKVSEDCLWLNVARPNGTKASDRLPVLVHIHGGSFIGGSKDEPSVQPGGLILESVQDGNPVMQVNINYRLGVFGFAKSSALLQEGSENAGLRDQRLGLEWVQANIAYFGGDPNRITIFGQSSGGLAVGIQSLAYGGDRAAPFQRVIAESQVLEPGITGNITDVAYSNVVQNTTCGNASAAVQSAATVSCLRGLDMKTLLQAQIVTAEDGDQWLPAVDGDFLPAAPSELIAQRKFVPSLTDVIIGWCDGDTNFFIDPAVRTANDTAAFFHNYAPGVSQSNLQHLLGLYPVSEFQANPSINVTAEFYRSGRIFRDILMVCEPLLFGQGFSSSTPSNTSKTATTTKSSHSTSSSSSSSSLTPNHSVYFYDQNQTFLNPYLNALNLSGLGVVHTSEFAYVFGNLSHYDLRPDYPFLPNATDVALARRQSRSWAAFAALGHPSKLNGSGGAGNTLQGWVPAFGSGGGGGAQDVNVFVVGGPREGPSTIAGVGAANAVLRDQKIQERCAFINSAEMVRQLQF